MSEEAQYKRKAFTEGDVENIKSFDDLKKHHQEEHSRREKAMQENRLNLDDDIRDAEDATSKNASMREDPNQVIYKDGYEWVMVNLGNIENRPCSQQAAFRILGFFRSKEEAKEHYLECCRNHPWIAQEVPPHVLPTGRFALIARKFEDQQNPEYVWGAIDTILDKYYKTLEENRDEHRMNVQNQSTGRTTSALERQKQQKRIKSQKMTHEETSRTVRRQLKRRQLKSEGTKARSWPRDCEIRGQNVATICYVADNRPEVEAGREKYPEPVVRFHAGHENDEENDSWIDVNAANKIRFFKLDCVDMYDWKTPQNVTHKNIKKERQRNPELDRAISQQTTETKKVASFEEWCATEDAAMPETIVDASGRVHKSEAAKKPAVSEKHDEGRFDINRQTGEVRKLADGEERQFPMGSGDSETGKSMSIMTGTHSTENDLGGVNKPKKLSRREKRLARIQRRQTEQDVQE